MDGAAGYLAAAMAAEQRRRARMQWIEIGSYITPRHTCCSFVQGAIGVLAAAPAAERSAEVGACALLLALAMLAGGAPESAGAQSC